MKWIKLLVVGILFIGALSCHKPPPLYQNRVAQDPSYRMGKWYSVSDTTNDSKLEVNSLLDTIWFINDTLAGWTGFIPNQPHNYSFWTTYFLGANYIVYLAPNIQNPAKIDTIIHQCAMSGDTFVMVWDLTTYPAQTQSYLKAK